MRSVCVLVVGAGPAGMSAAVASARCGARVTVADDNATAGGQIWRGVGTNSSFRKFEESRITFKPLTAVVRDPGNWDRLIVATGAREIFLPFPGWTLPGICGVGGLQALVKSGMPVAGKSVVVAGSGPLLLAVASHLRKAGARVRLIAEQASSANVRRFALGLWRFPAKLASAAALRASLAGVPYLTDCWIESAVGQDVLKTVTLRQENRRWTEPCDIAGVGYGLQPTTELAATLGCRIVENAVAVDAFQQTSVANVYAAGECTGVGGVELSLVEGEIAGWAACGETAQAEALFAKRTVAARFAAELNTCFALRSELRQLPAADTIVCRCEDVPYGKLLDFKSFRAAKLQTRCGMGPCQGRICGASLSFLLGWQPEPPRAPIFPVTLSELNKKIL